MFEVLFTQTSMRQFEKLENNVQMRIKTSLERIKVRPYSFVEKLTNSTYFRLRVGDYRIILDIRNNELIIFVIEVGHRKNIYKS